ncbi:MAG: TetR/AcrR family transcriptional regulator [Phyllobacteriaceae bacterium]|nr:TetR/AcrR family transcriptional regulator [Phyllobacteriaceae bacterium]
MSAREKLLDAAAALAVKHGVTALGVERVVNEAGLSKGAFFYHFATKEEMVRGLLDHVAAQRIAEVEKAVSKGARFTDALIDMLVKDAKNSGPLIHVLIASVAIDPGLRETLTKRSDAWRQRMIDEDGISPDQADLLRVAMDGLMVTSVLYQGDAGRLQRDRAVAAVRAVAEKLEAGHQARV